MDVYDERDSVFFTDIKRRDEFLEHLKYIRCDAVILNCMSGVYKVTVLEKRQEVLTHGK